LARLVKFQVAQVMEQTAVIQRRLVVLLMEVVKEYIKVVVEAVGQLKELVAHIQVLHQAVVMAAMVEGVCMVAAGAAAQVAIQVRQLLAKQAVIVQVLQEAQTVQVAGQAQARVVAVVAAVVIAILHHLKHMLAHQVEA
jgi:hypothetical protein